jgi:hypothetical protein
MYEVLHDGIAVFSPQTSVCRRCSIFLTSIGETTMSSTSAIPTGISDVANTSADSIAQMQQLASENQAFTMQSLMINTKQQETSALASVGNTGAKNISDAAKGQ